MTHKVTHFRRQTKQRGLLHEASFIWCIVASSQNKLEEAAVCIVAVAFSQNTLADDDKEAEEAAVRIAFNAVISYCALRRCAPSIAVRTNGLKCAISHSVIPVN